MYMCWSDQGAEGWPIVREFLSFSSSEAWSHLKDASFELERRDHRYKSGVAMIFSLFREHKKDSGSENVLFHLVGSF